jgi:demethylmenaquinone methyltransferase/2-methoxy-6-polyprenyl-1,4-benzoquinol methylase
VPDDGRPSSAPAERIGGEAGAVGRDPGRIAAMFDRIVPRYDLMNRLMTAGLDRRWRALAAAEAAVEPGAPVLDACCGTGDLALALHDLYPASDVTGLDFSRAMLSRARAKAERPARSRAGEAPGEAPNEAPGSLTFVLGDLLTLPFADDAFAAATVGWGVRNVADVPRAFAELARVVRPGGRVVCLEATTPPPGPGRRFHRVWFERVVPWLGAVVAGDRAAYSYLPASVAAFPDADRLVVVMRDAGLTRIRFRRLGFGAMALHVGVVA